MKSAHEIMLQIQRQQHAHDLLAHRDILNLDTTTRLKHMALHFLKYAGKISAALEKNDHEKLKHTVVDIFIICLATANSLNFNLGKSWSESSDELQSLAETISRKESITDVFKFSLFKLVEISGQMAKSIESTDHLEKGNPRSELEALIPDLTRSMLIALGQLQVPIEDSVRERWLAVQSKSIFSC